MVEKIDEYWDDSAILRAFEHAVTSHTTGNTSTQSSIHDNTYKKFMESIEDLPSCPSDEQVDRIVQNYSTTSDKRVKKSKRSRERSNEEISSIYQSHTPQEVYDEHPYMNGTDMNSMVREDGYIDTMEPQRPNRKIVENEDKSSIYPKRRMFRRRCGTQRINNMNPEMYGHDFHRIQQYGPHAPNPYIPYSYTPPYEHYDSFYGRNPRHYPMHYLEGPPHAGTPYGKRYLNAPNFDETPLRHGPPMPQRPSITAPLDLEQDKSLSSLLMSWYWCGYYAGRFEAEQNERNEN